MNILAPFAATISPLSIPTSSLLLVCAGIAALNAVMVACYYALVKLRYMAISPETYHQLRNRKSLAFIMDRAESIGKSLHLGASLCTFILGFVIFLYFQNSLNLQLPISDFEKLLVLILMGLGLFIVQSTFSYWLPRALGMAFPIHTLQSNSWFMLLANTLIAPIAHMLRASVSHLCSFIGIQTKEVCSVLDLYVQIRALGDNHASIPKFTQEILENALRMRDLEVADILLPRDQIQFMNLKDTLAFNMQKAKQEGYTRYPLCEGNLDNCIGFLHIKDLFCQDTTPKDIVSLKRPNMRVQLNTPIQKVLRRLLHKRMHMALVVDEFHRTVGMITLEHIIEELVGDIQDEFDKEEDSIQRIAPHTFQITGLTPIHEVEEVLHISLPHENVATFGGLITSELGRIPEKGEQFNFENIQITIIQASQRRVIAAQVTVLGIPDESSESSEF